MVSSQVSQGFTTATPKALDLTRQDGIRLKLADSAADVEACQALRFKVFYEDGGARRNADSLTRKLDADVYDEICDHLMVIDNGVTVGTYRLLRQEKLPPGWSLYSQSEFDLASLLERKKDVRFLELGRSCVLTKYRTKRVIEMLWQAIWDYVRAHHLDVMLGCASLNGTAVSELRQQLAYLHHFHGAPAEWAVRAHDVHYVPMDMCNKDQIKPRKVLKAIPPLLKGYLRLGGYVGDGAVIDEQFNTTDVLIILPVSAINPRYFARFGAPNPSR